MTTLFQSLRVGALTLPNRIVMAPLGRARADAQNREPTPSVVTYYVQRASAGLIISEATHISPNSVSRPGTSAIHSDPQVVAWRRVTDAVHLAGGRNPDLVERLRRDAPWNTPDPNTFYSGGDRGYIDYPSLAPPPALEAAAAP
jgi:2,4-dienoyl-CoA reductase-like NADH-dependent reductase (Old Yellow Enzyme family)